jgi:HK97 family phage prohead protease
MGGQVGIDDALGIVECFVAAIGNKDSVGDIIVPGAFNKSLKRRKPRVVWGHDWNQPIGKVIDIFEVGPSDPRLPMKMKQAGVGAVYARVQLNLKSERGREAFSFVQFFGEEQEWSIGYKTLDAVFDPKLQANILKELELYEVSPVLHGANQLTSTLSVKNDKGGDMRIGMPVVEGRPILDAEESDLRDSLLRIVSTHGRFNEDSQGVWAGYTPANENEVASIGVKCSNCVFYNRDGSCDIIAMDIEPGGKCRFAVIPKGVVDVDTDDDDLKMWLPSGDSEERVKFLEDDDERLLAVEIDDDEKAMISRIEEMDDDEFDGSFPDDEQKWGFSVPGAFLRRAITNRKKRRRRPMMGKAAPGSDALNQIANIVGIDAPQERITGDVLRGYGPRRGNLERLLRYWRPIMKKPGGFRRCRVILANHPELYPLENICAWLHHETTGLWPNEGCHHPGMKNCKKKLKKGKRIVGGSLWSDAQWNNRLASRFGKDDYEGMEDGDEETGTDWNEKEFKDFSDALKRFVASEPDFADFLRDDDNWESEGEDEEGMSMVMPYAKKPGCGCGGSKSAFDDDLFGIKAGRVLSSSNIAKLKQAAELINDVLTIGEVQFKGAAFVLSVEDASDLMSHIAPVVSNYDLSVSVKSQTVTIDGKNMTTDAATAIGNAIGSYTEWVDEDGYSVKGLGGMDPNARDGDGDGMVQDNTVYQRPASPKKFVSAAVSGAFSLKEKYKKESMKALKDEEPTTTSRLFSQSGALRGATDKFVDHSIKIPGTSIDRTTVLDALPVTSGVTGEKIRDYTSKDGSISIPMELWSVIKKNQYGGGPDAKKFRAEEYWLNAEQLDNFQAEARKKAQELREIYSDIWKEMPKAPKGGADQFLRSQSTTDGAVKRMFSDKAPKVSPKEALAAVIVKWETMASLIEENKKKIAAFQARVLEAQKSLLQDGVSFDDHKDWVAPVASYHDINYTVKGDRVFYDTKGVNTEAFAALEKAVKGLSGMDPDARDADGDGMVQDGTVYQRPATPKKPVKKPSAEKPEWFYEGSDVPGPFLGEAKPSDLKPKAELVGADLRDLDLTYRDLSGAWLFDVNARGQNFTGVNLANAKMNDADMSWSKFHKANLRNAFLVETNLSDTDFTGADLRGANFRGADLSSAKFSGAKLEGADFTDAKLAGADFIGVELNGVTFSPGALKNSFSDQSLAEMAARASTPPKKGMVS